MRIGIRERILLLTLGITFPLAGVGVLYLTHVWSISREQLDDSVKQQAELGAIAFERWVDAQRQPLITIAAVAEDQENQSYGNNFAYVVKTRPHWIDLRIVDEDGKTLLVQPQDREPPPPALVEYLIAESKQRKSWVLITDRTRDESRPLFAIAVPIENGGAVIARIDGSAITELFHDIQLPEGAVIAIFDSQGRRLYRKQTGHASIESEPNSSPLFNALGTRRVAVAELESPYDQIRRVYGLARAGATDFVVSVGVPSSTLYEPMHRQVQRYVFFSLLAFACALLAAVLLQRSIVPPLHRLRLVAQAFGYGHLSIRAPIDTRNEIGDLGAAFNMMAGQIEEREERLAELDRLKSEFVSNVSHELRTPLTTIKTLTHVLQRVQTSEATRHEYLDTIAAECDRQIELVTNLLDLSRIESGASEIELAPLDVAEIVETCASLGKHAAEVRGQKLTTELSSDSALALGNKVALRRVIHVLIENALKYSPVNGEITVGVTESNDTVALYVKDNGCGISSGDLPHVFERFYRGHTPLNKAEQNSSKSRQTTVQQPGVGLGLHIAAGLVESMGGRISLTSELGTGSTFIVYLKKWVQVGEEEQEEETGNVEPAISS